jgi:hypothetical protein
VAAQDLLSGASAAQAGGASDVPAPLWRPIGWVDLEADSVSLAVGTRQLGRGRSGRGFMEPSTRLELAGAAPGLHVRLLI